MRRLAAVRVIAVGLGLAAAALPATAAAEPRMETGGTLARDGDLGVLVKQVNSSTAGERFPFLGIDMPPGFTATPGSCSQSDGESCALNSARDGTRIGVTLGGDGLEPGDEFNASFTTNQRLPDDARLAEYGCTNGCTNDFKIGDKTFPPPGQPLARTPEQELAEELEYWDSVREKYTTPLWARKLRAQAAARRSDASRAEALLRSVVELPDAPQGIDSTPTPVFLEHSLVPTAQVLRAAQRRARRPIRLARARSSISAGETKRISARLSAKARRLLRKLRRARIRTRLTLTDPTGGPPIVATTTRTIRVPRGI